MTADLGACEWFVWDLRRSNLVERGRLEQVVAEFMMRHPRAEPAELASYLVDQGILTRFQADSLLNGKSQGLVLGPFIVHDILGTGTMGTVYKAKNKVNNEWFAVKVLPRRSMWNIRLARRKVRDFEQFQHSAVVPFVDVGTSGAMHYLAWPLVDGEPLSKLVERTGRLDPAKLTLIAMLTCEGLEACHQRNIIHGLLKPSNIMVGSDNNVKILDFGVGSLLMETEGESVVDTMSAANTMASGLDCASPESIMDPTSMSFASDQYSLGCIMYYGLTGEFPFPGNNAVEKMMAHQTKQPTPIRELAPDASEELVAIIERLMQKRPEDRFPSISDVIVALRPLVLATATGGQRKTGPIKTISTAGVKPGDSKVRPALRGGDGVSVRPTPPRPMPIAAEDRGGQRPSGRGEPRPMDFENEDAMEGFAQGPIGGGQIGPMQPVRPSADQVLRVQPPPPPPVVVQSGVSLVTVVLLGLLFMILGVLSTVGVLLALNKIG